MKVETSIEIAAKPAEVWAVITDFENSAKTIQAIEKIEVLDKPKSGLVGFKWRETRKMFGKEATEVMWITEVEDGASYTTRAESHGSVYISGLRVVAEGDQSRLTMSFEGLPQSFGAKVMSVLMGAMMKSSVVKAFRADLADIKAAVEQ